MTREACKAKLIALGIAEPTDEQITSMLNTIGGEVKNEKDRADRLSKDAEKVAELQKQLEELNSKGLSEVELANKATEKANARIAELEKSIKSMQTQKQLAELGIVGETADKLISADGNIDFSVLGQILSEAKSKSAAEKEAELAGKAGNPGSAGGSVNDQGGKEKTGAEKYAKEYAKRASENSKAASDALASYLN